MNTNRLVLAQFASYAALSQRKWPAIRIMMVHTIMNRFWLHFLCRVSRHILPGAVRIKTIARFVHHSDSVHGVSFVSGSWSAIGFP
jgi:hypothetical protein